MGLKPVKVIVERATDVFPKCYTYGVTFAVAMAEPRFATARIRCL